MLNQHEVAAHNRAVALKIENKVLERLDPVKVMAENERREKAAAKRILPTCKPEDRAPRKIYMGGKNTGTRSHAVRSAMPTPIERIAHANGVILSPSRVPQTSICMDKVKAYLTK